MFSTRPYAIFAHRSKRPKSEMGQFRKSDCATVMSAFPPLATRQRTSRDVSKVPEADMAMGLFDHLVGARKNARRDDRILIT
jgi:hypothetical protein